MLAKGGHQREQATAKTGEGKSGKQVLRCAQDDNFSGEKLSKAKAKAKAKAKGRGKSRGKSRGKGRR
jgi:hypothetical protein